MTLKYVLLLVFGLAVVECILPPHLRKNHPIRELPLCLTMDRATGYCTQCYYGIVNPKMNFCSWLDSRSDLCEVYGLGNICKKCKKGYALNYQNNTCVEGYIDNCYSEFIKEGIHYCQICENGTPTHDGESCVESVSDDEAKCQFGMRSKGTSFCVLCHNMFVSLNGICKEANKVNYGCALEDANGTCIYCQFSRSWEINRKGKCNHIIMKYRL